MLWFHVGCWLDVNLFWIYANSECCGLGYCCWMCGGGCAYTWDDGFRVGEVPAGEFVVGLRVGIQL